MTVAIAILNWNGIELLKKYLPSVIEYSPNANVYLVDNHSTDGSLEWVAKNHPCVKPLKMPNNLGFAKAYNVAIKHLKEEFVCCLNSDVRVTKGWLDPMLDLLANNPAIAVVQPKILDDKKPEYFEYAGAAGGFLDNLGYPYCRGRVFWTLEQDNHQYDDNVQIHWATGAAMLFKQSVFNEVNGFDEDFFIHQEEVDLCWRIRNAGHLVYCCGESLVYHLGGASLDAENPYKTYMNFRNNLLMLTKNLPLTKVFVVVAVRLILDGVTALVFWRYHGFKHLLAIAKAHLSYYAMLPRFIKKRQAVKQQHYACKNNVPMQYFLLKRTRFKELH